MTLRRLDLKWPPATRVPRNSESTDLRRLVMRVSWPTMAGAWPPTPDSLAGTVQGALRRRPTERPPTTHPAATQRTPRHSHSTAQTLTTHSAAAVESVQSSAAATELAVSGSRQDNQKASTKRGDSPSTATGAHHARQSWHPSSPESTDRQRSQQRFNPQGSRNTDCGPQRRG